MSRVARLPVLRRVAAALAGIAAMGALTPASAAPWSGRFSFAAPAFADVWAAADAPVATGQASRSWTWGPEPWFDYAEFYRPAEATQASLEQAPGGLPSQFLRQVQYFDKARMEINDPAVAGVAGVTNGLLTVEMVSGRIKIGGNIHQTDNPSVGSAQVPVAGDPARDNPVAPTYASFAGVATTDNGYRDVARTGQRVTAVLDRNGNRTVNEALGADAATEIVAYNTVTGHNIPRVFNDFITTGPVDGLFAFGYPITDPYWIRARVGGQERDVLVQLYERRAVTYTPSNPAAFRVEMGNVGQHYFQWRYGELGQPWSHFEFNYPIAYASKGEAAGDWEVWAMNADGRERAQVTSGGDSTLLYSWRRTFAGGAPLNLLIDSNRDDGVRRLFSVNMEDFDDVRTLVPTFDDASYWNGAVSPDGKQIVAAFRESSGISRLVIQPYDGGLTWHLTNPQPDPDCHFESPSWLVDGSGLVFVTDCFTQPGASRQLGVYRADLYYTSALEQGFIAASIAVYRPLAVSPDGSFPVQFPRVSPDGSQVVFSAQGDLYTVAIDGGNWRRLTSNPGDDGAASWSPNGEELVFDSNRDGDYELYRMRLDDPGRVTRLTDNSVDDRWPVWYQ